MLHPGLTIHVGGGSETSTQQIVASPWLAQMHCLKYIISKTFQYRKMGGEAQLNRNTLHPQFDFKVTPFIQCPSLCTELSKGQFYPAQRGFYPCINVVYQCPRYPYTLGTAQM